MVTQHLNQPKKVGYQRLILSIKNTYSDLFCVSLAEPMKDDDPVEPLPEHLRHQQRGNRVLDEQR